MAGGDPIPPGKGSLGADPAPQLERTAQGSPLPKKRCPREDRHPWDVMTGVPSPHESPVDGPPAPPRVPAPTLGSPSMRVATVPVTCLTVQLVELVLHVEEGAAHPLQDQLHPCCTRPCGDKPSPLPVPGGDRETKAWGGNSS